MSLHITISALLFFGLDISGVTNRLAIIIKYLFANKQDFEHTHVIFGTVKQEDCTAVPIFFFVEIYLSLLCSSKAMHIITHIAMSTLAAISII